MFWYGKPQFFGVIGAASNISTSRGDYTIDQFREDYPQFFSSTGQPFLPETIMAAIIDMANSCIQPDKWLDIWRYAVGLYVAHYATLQLRTYAPYSDTQQQAAASGALVGVVKTATLGDASVSYDTSTVTAGTEDWGDLNSTIYGQMLANKAKLVGMAGTVVI